MNSFALEKPALLCTFTALDGTLPTDYPWTGVGEIRPQVDGVDQQFVQSPNVPWALASNRLTNRGSSLLSNVGINLGQRARRVLLNVENDEVGAYNSNTAIIIRASADVSTMLTVRVNRNSSGVLAVQVRDEVSILIGSALSITGAAIGTMQPLEVIDHGSALGINYAGFHTVIETSLYNDQYLVGVGIANGSATVLQAMDNLIAWT